MKEYEKILKALANRRRLALLKRLKSGEANVSELASVIHLSFKSTSKHLGVLAAVGMVERDQRGLEMFYSLAQNRDQISGFMLRIL